MIIATFAVLSLLVISGLSAPTKLMRRGPPPIEVYESMSVEGKALADKIILQLQAQGGGHPLQYSNARLTAEEASLRALVELSESDHVDAPAAARLLQWWEDDVKAFETKHPRYKAFVQKALSILEKARQEPSIETAGQDETPPALSSTDQESVSNKQPNTLKKTLKTGAIGVAAALGIGGVAAGTAYAIKSQEERSFTGDSKGGLDELD